jgi:hypothetical protein
MALYYVALRPLKIVQARAPEHGKYDSAGLVPRFEYFKTWHQYEYFHTALWLCKDLSWNQGSGFFYIFFLTMTLFISFDFIYMTYSKPFLKIDCMHYISITFWVMGNATWALAEIFHVDSDVAYSFFEFSKRSFGTARWWASWFIILAFVPIIYLYCVWLPLVVCGRWSATSFEKVPRDERPSDSSSSERESAVKPVGVLLGQGIVANRQKLSFRLVDFIQANGGNKGSVPLPLQRSFVVSNTEGAE